MQPEASETGFVRVDSDLTCATQARLPNDSVTHRGWVVLDEARDPTAAEVVAAQTAAVLHERGTAPRASAAAAVDAAPPDAAVPTAAQSTAPAPEPSGQCPPLAAESVGGAAVLPAATTSSSSPAGGYVRRCECLGASAGHHRATCPERQA